ncbi:MAG: cysteine synthase A [Syntrophothermus sp.]|uniref:cysteine synthase A n=1 Tax=Syntrophothermus sp. TaxID=2736299 RepID=UPI00257A9978|nr:cysteine synthase A [Syntrophothermus sp.]NSW81690.1 cysteine synthase A [Syntrophothermus sp.]
MIAGNVTELIGKTPIMRLNKLAGPEAAEVLLKLEFFNPGGSIKDRIGIAMILDAEAKGLIKPGGTIVEPTSGNTGIGLAVAAAARGYRLVIVMPDSMSAERRQMLKAYGADLVLTPGDQGMAGAVRKAEELVRENRGWFMPNQFANPSNPEIHYRTTGPEIWQAVEGRLDYFVAGVGTGGTLTGTARYLKERTPELKVIAVEPKNSPVLSGGQPGLHLIQGIGPGFVPEVLDMSLVDEVVQVSDEDAYRITRRLAREEGLLVGISSGAAVWAALEIAGRLGSGHRILAIAPDTGERYLSTGVFD